MVLCYSANIFYYSLDYFFFNDTATTEIYTLSLHDALPIFGTIARCRRTSRRARVEALRRVPQPSGGFEDRKSTRLNSSHTVISYAVFCLKKKKLKKKIYKLSIDVLMQI